MPETIKELVEKARAAQKVIEFWSQEKVDEMIAAVAWFSYKQENAEKCAKLAVEETGMGAFETKLIKHQKKTLGTLRDLDGVKSVGIIEEWPEKKIIKLAKPVGVVGALVPVTNPTSTPPGNGLPILKGRNAVIFAPHPRGKKSTKMSCDYMRAALETIGAPADLVQCIENPSVSSTQELMREVDLINATGGAAMVKVAYSSGTPAYGVGAGNSTIIVDETADIADATKKIFLGKTFDNATSCSSENSLVIQESIWDKVIEGLKSHGGYLCNEEEKEKLKNVMWPPDKNALNIDIVAKSAKTIADLAGLNVPEDVTFIMVSGSTPGPEDLFTGEKLSPVMTLWKYKEFDDAIGMVIQITNFCGRGHSCGIHTVDDDRIMKLAEKVQLTRIMVCQPESYGNSGNYDNGMPFSMTLGCGTWGGNSISENVTWRHFINTTWVSKPIEPVIPDEDKLFGAYWEKFGK
jgi:sulfoacetaldehyde dehydrogenase